jgi:DNA-binding transcriptional LysR family regulator
VQRRTSPQNLLALVAAGVGVTCLPLSRSLRGSGVVFVALAGDVHTSCSPGAPRPRRRRSSPSLGVVREMARGLDPLTAA